MPGSDGIQVAIQVPLAFIRVVGRGSFKISASLKEFAVHALDAGCRRIVLDMAECVGMDSTFMGVLAGLAFRLRAVPEGRIVIVNLNPRTRGLLATLGLDEAVETHMAGATPADLEPLLARGEALTELPAEERGQAETARTMLEAHENLVRLSPENLPKFKDVLTFLREDLKKSGGAAPGAR
ncbi:MAG TPA: STAS domain-containing protein [Kiritimatiellia bacterium]|nr:STAS domain-containing protein [Kiritimatiellia bacterium]HRZ12133.1 STAS domain-containing protein [Kiritimatiellia bacterium]HSA18109.1 STAS domain-containing protein [Kiritimatiellia bacterium]